MTTYCSLSPNLMDEEIRQLNLLKEKTSIERFQLMLQLIESQFLAMKSGFKFKNPNFTEQELEECRKKRMREIYSLKL